MCTKKNRHKKPCTYVFDYECFVFVFVFVICIILAAMNLMTVNDGNNQSSDAIVDVGDV